MPNELLPIAILLLPTPIVGWPSWLGPSGFCVPNGGGLPRAVPEGFGLNVVPADPEAPAEPDAPVPPLLPAPPAPPPAPPAPPPPWLKTVSATLRAIEPRMNFVFIK